MCQHIFHKRKNCNFSYIHIFQVIVKTGTVAQALDFRIIDAYQKTCKTYLSMKEVKVSTNAPFVLNISIEHPVDCVGFSVCKIPPDHSGVAAMRCF